MPVLSLHSQYLNALNLQEGDIVKITHAVPTHHMEWKNSWTEGMNKAVGKTGTVISISDRDSGVCINIQGISNYNYPAYCIEVVEKGKPTSKIKISKDYTATVYPGDRIEVGCQVIDKNTFNKIKEAFEK